MALIRYITPIAASVIHRKKELPALDIREPVFMCDVCGEECEGEGIPVYDENWNRQEGLLQCEECFQAKEYINSKTHEP